MARGPWRRHQCRRDRSLPGRVRQQPRQFLGHHLCAAGPAIGILLQRREGSVQRGPAGSRAPASRVGGPLVHVGGESDLRPRRLQTRGARTPSRKGRTRANKGPSGRRLAPIADTARGTCKRACPRSRRSRCGSRPAGLVGELGDAEVEQLHQLRSPGPAIMKMLSGLRSRWTIPCACATDRASEIPNALSTVPPQWAASRPAGGARPASRPPAAPSPCTPGRGVGLAVEHPDDLRHRSAAGRAGLGEEPPPRAV